MLFFFSSSTSVQSMSSKACRSACGSRRPSPSTAIRSLRRGPKSLDATIAQLTSTFQKEKDQWSNIIKHETNEPKNRKWRQDIYITPPAAFTVFTSVASQLSRVASLELTMTFISCSRRYVARKESHGGACHQLCKHFMALKIKHIENT